MENVLYDTIGEGYNQTRKADPYIAGRVYTSIYQGKDKPYLDIGCGTGNYTIKLLNTGGLTMYGIDPSEKMLGIARQRDSAIRWLQGAAESIPAADGFFVGAFGILTLHHWRDIPKGFRELYRVVAPGGGIAFFTSSPEQMERYWLNHYFPDMLAASIRQMPSIELIGAAARNAGFEAVATQPYFVSHDLEDHFLYTGKMRPELYLDKDIRSGISSFAALAHAEEVARGLSALREDIRTGRINAIRARYEGPEGDYLIFTAKKKDSL